MGAHGHVQEIDGSIRVNRQGRPITQTVLFRKDEATLLNDWQPMGLRGTSSGSYRVENVFVPEDQSGTRETPECRRDPGPLFAFPMQGLYAVGVLGCALGLASAMMKDFHGLAVAKTPRGRGRLADDKLTQAKFAQHHASLKAAKSFADQTLSKLYNEAPNEGAIGLKERASVRLICSHGIQASVEAADWVHRAAGVSAIFLNPLLNADLEISTRSLSKFSPGLLISKLLEKFFWVVSPKFSFKEKSHAYWLHWTWCYGQTNGG